MKKLLPTSTAGSLPKPSWLAEPEKLWSPWKLENEGLIEGKKDALRLALHEQKLAGIDIVSDGEQTRQHFVTTFIEHLNGVDFEKRETVRIRDRYDASVPSVVGAVSRQKPVFVEDAKFLRQQTDQPIKWALPGPMTMIDTLYDGHYKSREKLAWEFAKILNQEAKELEAAGVDIIQFDEPAFNVFFDEVNDWGIATLERAIEGLKCETAVHICYGYGIKANTDWKKTLGSEWRQYEEAFPKLQTSNIDIISLECHNSRVPIDLLELIRGKKVMVGAIDVATNQIETPEEVANTLRKALQFVDSDKLYPASSDADQEHIPVLVVQMPSEPSVIRFYVALLAAMGAPLRPRPRLPEMEQLALALLRKVGVRMLVIDELHNVLAGNSVNRREFLNLLRFLGNELRIPLVGVGTRDAYLAIRSDDQLENRFEPMMLPVWEANDDCCSLLASFAASLPLRRPSPIATLDMARYLLTRSEGTIGELAHLLMAAAIVAVESGEEAINHRTLSMACRQPLAQPRHRGRTASDLEATGPSHPDMDLDARTDVRFRVLGVLR
ncbi:methionine synthase [Acinetobacter baumannii]|nr:methionine synthase [Acinetobacter baumannii]